MPSNGAALARNGIFQVLREGRKLGLSMIMTTQSPLDLPAELRSQFPNVLVHRLTTPEEQTALGLGSSQEQLATGQVLVYQDGQEVAEGQVNLPDWWGKE